jgi:hypothetical protein
MRFPGCSGRVVLAAVLGLASGAGCKKDAKATTASGSPEQTLAKPPADAAVPSKRALHRKFDDSSAALLRYLPRDSSVVLGINWRKARKSEVVRSYDDKIAKGAPALAEIKAKCGMDPISDVHSVAIGLGPDPANDDGMVIAVSGNFTRASVEDCVRAQGGKVEGNRYDDEINVYWPSASVIILSKGQSSEQLALAPSASAWDNDKLMVLVDELDLHACLWIAGLVPGSLAATFTSMGGAPWGGYASVDIETGMSATLGLEYAEESEAKSAMTMFSMGLDMGKGQPQLSSLLDSVTIGVVGTAVVVVGDFAAAQVSQMQMLLRQLGL